MAPPVFIYVGGVVIALGAAYALKQFVYEPYVAPQLEKWAQAFVESRRRAHSERRERRMHSPMSMRSDYVPLSSEEENDYRRGAGKPPAPVSPRRGQNEWDDPVEPVPIELEKFMGEKERLSWAERDLPAHMPLPAAAVGRAPSVASAQAGAPGLRKRTGGSRPASRPQSFVEIVEGPGIPVSAYVPLTPQTTHTGSPRLVESKLQQPLSPSLVPAAPAVPPTLQQPIPAAPLLSPPMSASSPPVPVMRALSPRLPHPTPPVPALPAVAQHTFPPLLGTIEDLTSPLAGDPPVHLVLRSSTLPRTSESAYALAPSASASPYPSRPASALSAASAVSAASSRGTTTSHLSSVFSPPLSPRSVRSPDLLAQELGSLSLPISRTQSWTALSRASEELGSDADVLSRSSGSVLGTSDDEDEETGSELGSAWDAVSRRSGLSEQYVRM